MDKEKYKHCDHDDNLICLSDCVAEKMSFQKGVLSFYFIKDGICILPDHPENKLNHLVRTDEARVDYHVLDNDEIEDIITICLFIKKGKKKTIRKYWKAEKFMKAVNSGKFRIEFITPYKNPHSYLYKCWVYFDKKPWHNECEMIINTDKVSYCWNRLCEDKIVY